jgi:flagellar protein FlaG
MSALDIQPSSINPPFEPEISSPVRRTTLQGDSQELSQQRAESVPLLDLVARQQDLRAFLSAAEKKIEGYDPNTCELSVGVDNDTHRIVVKLMDSKTKEIIRQIPAEEILRFSRDMKKMKVGHLDETA